MTHWWGGEPVERSDGEEGRLLAALAAGDREAAERLVELTYRGVFALLRRLCGDQDLASDLTDPGDLLAVEYRTIRDLRGPKVTASHYRRYILPAAFEARALGRGFDVIYAVEGFGFAKYKEDDAYVARTIFRRHDA